MTAGSLHIRIGSRKSDLARLQAYSVGDALKKFLPSLTVEYHFRESFGDLDIQTPLSQMGDRGVFTNDFYQDLLQNRLDLVVHSWKDLPVENRRGTSVLATLPRADVRDVLLVSKDWIENKAVHNRLRVLTSSPRRVYNLQNNLKHLLPIPVNELEFLNVRGNVPTRLQKLYNGEGDALVVAKAALDRLLSSDNEEFLETQKKMRAVLKRTRWMVLPLTLNPSAAAQGALALEIKSDNGPLREILVHVNDINTFSAVEAERRILKNYGGGCHQKIGINVLFRPYGRITFLKGLTDQGVVLDEISHENMYEFKPWPKTNADHIFPQSLDQMQWFERSEIADVELPTQSDFYVARENAWLDRFEIKDDKCLWVSGLRSWRKLAERGVWVNGCSEGLGGLEKPDVDALLGRTARWCKLTHDQAPSTQSLPWLATYALKDRAEIPNLKGKTHFYWSSGSHFLRALKDYPEIKNGYHGCGPGLTVETIRKHILDAQRARVFLSFEDWQKHLFSAK